MIIIKVHESKENYVDQIKIFINQITFNNLCQIALSSFNLIFCYNILYILALRPIISQRILLQNHRTLILK